MKYLAKVKLTRNGARLTLYLRLWFINIPIDGYRALPENCWFVIEESLKEWKDYYKERLTVIDERTTI